MRILKKSDFHHMLRVDEYTDIVALPGYLYNNLYMVTRSKKWYKRDKYELIFDESDLRTTATFEVVFYSVVKSLTPEEFDKYDPHENLRMYNVFRASLTQNFEDSLTTIQNLHNMSLYERKQAYRTLMDYAILELDFEHKRRKELESLRNSPLESIKAHQNALRELLNK